MGSRYPKRGLIAGAVLALYGGGAAASGLCSPDHVDVRGSGGVARFSVEVADSGAERAQGLMFRKEMASMAGMLFVYDSPGPVAFWMKNTLIPLDMVFADSSGTVTRIHENAKPGNLVPIDGGKDVQFVLEVNAGMTRKLGLTEGAVLRHTAIGQGSAAWPCK
ncbi:DUF192 domain-containing protein [Gemmobacter aquarius]|uniref:DUF192 domain-containing protein n=1 Tax=Paragemmobacter aquarius TaxID=2169400 RepID=A0A2S0UKN4_9RHOB|nr:DUF192 domain-containing protein [Gemmobacter aquarius]AWB48366.1 DUF192 domain-containing protein [Gemmobacter aquarius]